MVGIAADHSVHCDDVSRWDAVGDAGKVADHALNAIGQLPLLRLARSRIEVRRRRIDERRRDHALRQEFEIEDAYSGTDVQHRIGRPHLVGDGFE